MKKLRLILYIWSIIFILGCDSNDENPPPSPPDTSSLGIEDFFGFVTKQSVQTDSTSPPVRASTFLGSNVNADVKIKGTERVFFINQEYLNTQGTLTDPIHAGWVERTVETGNIVHFSGKVILAQPTLIADIQTALQATPKEIEQSKIDASKISDFASFYADYHPVNGTYWTGSEVFKDNEDPLTPPIPANILNECNINDDVCAGVLLVPSFISTLKTYLEAGATLPDTVIVNIASLIPPSSDTDTQIKVWSVYFNAPKSVITTIQQALATSQESVDVSLDHWTPLILFSLSLDLQGIILPSPPES